MTVCYSCQQDKLQLLKTQLELALLTAIANNYSIPNPTSYPNSLTRGFEPGGINHSTNIRATLPNDYKPEFPTARKAWSEQRLSDE